MVYCICYFPSLLFYSEQIRYYALRYDALRMSECLFIGLSICARSLDNTNGRSYYTLRKSVSLLIPLSKSERVFRLSLYICMGRGDPPFCIFAWAGKFLQNLGSRFFIRVRVPPVTPPRPSPLPYVVWGHSRIKAGTAAPRTYRSPNNGTFTMPL